MKQILNLFGFIRNFLGSIVCKAWGKHVKWRYPKGENKYCRVCGEAKVIKRRKVKEA